MHPLHRFSPPAALAAVLLFGCSEPPGAGAGGWPCDPDAYASHQKLDLPLEGEVGDPHVIKVDGTYYLYPSQDSVRPDGFQVLTSDDLVHWEDRGLVWEPTAGSWNEPGPPLDLGADCLYWAPSVHRGRDGAFYMYYTARCRIGVARADNPLGPFVDLNDHPLVGSGYGGVGTLESGSDAYDQLAIDPFLLDDPAEGPLLYFVAYTPVSKIYVVRLSDYGATLGDKQLLIDPGEQRWESLVAEGVWVEPVGDEYHLMYSGNFVRTLFYAIGAARSSSPLGPFERYPDNPILATSADWGIYGPGHHSVVEGLHGDRLIVYHSDDTDQDGSARSVRLASLCLDEDGRLAVRPDVTAPPSGARVRE